MMKSINLAVAILVFWFIPLAHAGNSTSQLHGFGASWTRYSYSFDGCAETGLDVGANQSTTHTNASGQPVTTDTAYVNWYVFDFCTGMSSGGSAWGDVSLSATMGNGGALATLTVSGQLNGFSCCDAAGVVVVNVNVTFNATGLSISHGSNTNTSMTPFAVVRTHYEGTTADAAMSGSITLGGSELIPSSGFGYGTLYTARSGSVSQFQH